jgi:hypothetical protein
MTEDEMNKLPAQTRHRVMQLEYMIREVLLDLGPLRTEDLLQEIACNIRAMKFE